MGSSDPATPDVAVDASVARERPPGGPCRPDAAPPMVLRQTARARASRAAPGGLRGPRAPAQRPGGRPDAAPLLVARSAPPRAQGAPLVVPISVDRRLSSGSATQAGRGRILRPRLPPPHPQSLRALGRGGDESSALARRGCVVVGSPRPTRGRCRSVHTRALHTSSQHLTRLVQASTATRITPPHNNDKLIKLD